MPSALRARITLIAAATGSCIRATRPMLANSAACIVAFFCIWLKAAGTVITVPISGSFRTSSGRYPNNTRRISAEHSSGVMVRSTADSLIGVLVPISRLKSIAALSGLCGAESYALFPTYLLPRRSMYMTDGVTSFCSGLFQMRASSPL